MHTCMVGLHETFISSRYFVYSLDLRGCWIKRGLLKGYDPHCCFWMVLTETTQTKGCHGSTNLKQFSTKLRKDNIMKHIFTTTAYSTETEPRMEHYYLKLLVPKALYLLDTVLNMRFCHHYTREHAFPFLNPPSLGNRLLYFSLTSQQK